MANQFREAGIPRLAEVVGRGGSCPGGTCPTRNRRGTCPGLLLSRGGLVRGDLSGGGDVLHSKSTEAGAKVGGQTVNNLRFVDDIDLVAEDDGQLQELTDEVRSSSQRFGLKINVEKTKTMTIGKQRKTVELKIKGESLEQVTEFIYLGGVITEDG